jgi:hypothetical protein
MQGQRGAAAVVEAFDVLEDRVRELDRFLILSACSVTIKS